MQISSLVVCRTTTIDKENNFLSVIDLHPNLTFTVGPEEVEKFSDNPKRARLPLSIVVGIARSEISSVDNCTLRLSSTPVIDSKDEPLETHGQEVVLPKDTPVHFSIFSFNDGLISIGPGLYKISVELFDSKKGNNALPIDSRDTYVRMSFTFPNGQNVPVKE